MSVLVFMLPILLIVIAINISNHKQIKRDREDKREFNVIYHK